MRITNGGWIAVAGLAAVVLHAALTWRIGWPVPFVHDEFGHLLAADTFAHGRLTNPTHPMWMHFESFHIMQRPSYMAMYPPAQGFFLAIGQVLFGQPIVGMWLAGGLAVAAVGWMLAGWMPGRWARVGALLAATHPMMLLWGQNYWGGLVPVLGGALLLGAMRRLAVTWRGRDALWLGTGMSVLALSRPYEGAVLCLLCGFVLWVKRPVWPVWRRIAGLIGVIVVLLAGFMAYNNWRVTGSATKLPYKAQREQYASVRHFFLWQEPLPAPVYRHKVLESFYQDWERRQYVTQRDSAGMIDTALHKISLYGRGYLGLVGQPGSLILAVVLLATLPQWVGRPWMKTALVIWLVFSFTQLLVLGAHTHYAAPVYPLLWLCVVQAARHVRSWRHGRAWLYGLIAGYGVVIGVFLVVWFRTALDVDEHPWSRTRASMADRLSRDGQKHLIVVRYGPNHSPHDEWVYNAADIDAAPVVWAREMDAPANRRLVEYFHERRVWLLEADAAKPRLVPWREQG